MEIAASVVGLLAAGAQVSSILGQFISKAANAPELARTLDHEVGDFQFVLIRLQRLLLGSGSFDESRASMIHVEHLSFTLAGCVCTFSQLEKEVDRLKSTGKFDFWDRVRWARTESSLAQIIQRLQNNKLSLTLIMTVLTCESSTAATTSRQQLDQLIPSILNSSQSGRGPRISQSLQSVSTQITEDTQIDFPSTDPTSDNSSVITISTTSAASKNLYRLAFESTLFLSRPYRRTTDSSSLFSLDSSQRPKPRWSLYTGRSGDSVMSLPISIQIVWGGTLAQESSISSLTVPVTTDSLYNASRYNLQSAEALQALSKVGAPYLSLHEAVKEGKWEGVYQLLFEGAFIEERDMLGRTPLHLAVLNGHDAIAKLLVQRGADIQAKSKAWDTVLHSAAAGGQESTVQFLLNSGAHNNIINKEGEIPLHRAASLGHSKVCLILLQWGADVNARDSFNRNPLHRAAGRSHQSTIQLLLENGADRDARDSSGGTALDWADGRCAKLLREWRKVGTNTLGPAPEERPKPVARAVGHLTEPERQTMPDLSHI